MKAHSMQCKQTTTGGMSWKAGQWRLIICSQDAMIGPQSIFQRCGESKAAQDSKAWSAKEDTLAMPADSQHILHDTKEDGRHVHSTSGRRRVDEPVEFPFASDRHA